MNTELWSKIYNEHYPTLIHNMTNRMRGNHQGAEDIVQSVFTKLMEKYPDNIGDITTVGGLLQISSINLSITEYRRSLRFDQNITDDDFVLMPASHDVEEDVVHTIRNEMLRTAINRNVSAEYKQTLLHLLDGLSYKEIASAENVPIGTISTRIYKATKQLSRANLFD